MTQNERLMATVGRIKHYKLLLNKFGYEKLTLVVGYELLKYIKENETIPNMEIIVSSHFRDTRFVIGIRGD